MVLIFLTDSLYTVFLISSAFTTLLRLLKSTGVGFNLPLSNLLISDFRLAKSALSVKSDASTTAAFLSQIILHSSINLISAPILLLILVYGCGK